MFKLDIQKSEEPEIKLPASLVLLKKGEFQKKSTSALLTMPKPLTVWITTNCGKFLKRWDTGSLYLPPMKPVCRTRSNKNTTWNNRPIPNWERGTPRLYIVTLLI